MGRLCWPRQAASRDLLSTLRLEHLKKHLRSQARNTPLPTQYRRLCQKLLDHFQYYGTRGNYRMS